MEVGNVTQNKVNQIVGGNIKAYIEALGRTHAWVMEKADIPSEDFNNLLKGEGDISESVEKINELFGINNEFYFYNSNFKSPLTLQEEIKQSDIRILATTHYKAITGEEKAFQETLEILDDFITMIELLKPYDNFNPHPILK